MKKRFSKCLAGILSAVLVFSSADYFALAEEKSHSAVESELQTETLDEDSTEIEAKETNAAEEIEKETTSEKTTEEKATEKETTEERTNEEKTTEKETSEKETTEKETSEKETTSEKTTELETTSEKTTETETSREDETETTQTETLETETVEETTTEEETTEEETTEEETTELETIEEQDEEEREISAKGLLEVQMIAGVEMRTEQEFTVKLSDKESITVTLPKTESDSMSPAEVLASFSELEERTYDLQVSGDGYESYQQEVKIENLGGRLQIYVGKAPIVDGKDEHSGLIVYQNGMADNIVNAIQDKKYEKEYDFNNDGIVDLLDLDYFTRFVKEEAKPATLNPFRVVGAEDVEPELSDNTKLGKGSVSLEDMLQGNGIVKLQPEEDKTLSDSPVEMSFDFSKNGSVSMERILVSSPQDNALEAGRVVIVYEEDGKEQSFEVDFGNVVSGAARSARQTENTPSLSIENGILQVNLNGQIAVKRVTFKIAKTSDEKLNLAEISSVEFVDGMENKIPEPKADKPENIRVEEGNKSFVLSWDRQTNVTAYEIEITDPDPDPDKEIPGPDYRKTVAYQNVTINKFNGDKLENKKDYKVRVRSLNGEWKSDWSDEVTATPTVEGAPKRPDYLSVTGGYRNLQITWKEVEDADTYTVYYKEDGAETFEKIANIETSNYKLENLKDDTKYLVYVTATNEIGEGPASLTASDKTASGLDVVKLPAYKLINTSNGVGELSSHIKSAIIGGGGSMVDSLLDESANSALGLFDNDYNSYVYREDWDYGGAYPDNVKGVTVELDDTYDVGMITFAEPIDLGAYSHCTVQYWDESGKKQKASNVSILQKNSENRKYYLIKFKDAIRTSKLQIGVGRYNGALRKVTISEIKLYEYDSIEQDIINLYSDDLHISLKDSVTEKVIQDLQDRLDTADPVSGEYHPEKDLLQKDLDAARELWETGGLGGVVQINPDITSKKDSGLSVGGMNAWQSLGIAASAGEEIVVYVGNPGMKDGASTNLQIVFTQYHAEVNKFYETRSLKIGKNEIVVPKISSTDSEKGGALYVQYTGNNSKDQYAVRVSGGTRFPVLNLYHISDKAEREERIATYIQELKTYVADLEDRHDEVHSNGENENVAYDYKASECVLNSTDIQMDKMMLSIPASQVLAGLGSSNQEKTLADTVQAMDEMITLFYQHKGLTNSFAEGTDSAVIAKNHIPYEYLNIRYMKMFTGAFMYAAGNHIGIEWPETRGMMGGVPVVSTEDGKYVSGRYYGWGIAHEIGHEINQGAYAHAEVTNNYFSVLAQARDTNDSVRFKYSEVFKKVTSGTTGYADNVFTQLGLYWQLHLAYDRDYNYKTYDTYQEIFDNLFFARVDSYARNTAIAPAPDGVSLTLDGDRDQNLMRLASAAAQRDLSDFFIRWGMIPNEATTAYMNQFEPEERAIYYVDDAARVYEMENGSDGAITGKSVVTAKAEAKDSQVTLKITSTADAEVLQGYEITRVFIEQGKERREVCGFTQNGTFTDSVAFAANHTIAYEVTAIDKFMNRSKVYQADAVKIQGDGIQDKSAWTIETNMVSNDDKTEDATEEMPCDPEVVSASLRIIDDNRTTTFTGTADSADPYILLKLNRSTQVTALRYILSGSGESIADYKIEVSEDGDSYTEVKSGTFTLKNNSVIVYFENGEDPWVCTYDAAYVKITAVGQKGKELSVSELDLYGPSGDNVEFLSAEDEQSGIGLLERDYIYDTETKAKIPEGSIVFTGTYKGNPAYNVVVLYDENGKIVGGEDKDGNLVANQVIIAPDPGDAMLGEVSEGIWIYWFEPDSGVSEKSLPDKVRAELYRVDNALTNEGQRLVSDTLFVELPDTLPSIQINK